MIPKAKPGTTVLRIRAAKPGDKAGYIVIKNKIEQVTPLPARKKDTPYRYAAKPSSKKNA